jgi:hypothetical protein
MRKAGLLLLMALLSFAFVSAAAAHALDLQRLRMGGFLWLLGTLLGLGIAHLPREPVRHGTAPLLLGLLLAALAVQDLASGIDPIEYKLALPVLALLAAPRLALLLEGVDVARAVWRLLSGYVVVTAVIFLIGDAATLERGHDDLARWDATGSMVTHAGLCGIYAILAASRLARGTGPLARLAALALGAIALVMAFLTGTRTVLAAWTLFAILGWSAGDRAQRRHLLALALALPALLALHSAWVDASLARRLLGGADDYSSGRWSSIALWLGLLADHPLGLGLGAVRSTLADGRPALDGEALLEWPHNEPVRLLVEGGPLGLLFALLLLGHLARRAWLGARRAQDPLRRALLLALAADLLAQSLLQNFLNQVYLATAWALLIGILAAPPSRRTATAYAVRDAAGEARPSHLPGMRQGPGIAG